MSPQSGATGTRTNQTREAAQAPKLFLTTVLGIGPYCVEYADGEIVHTRSEDRQRLIAAAPEMLEALRIAEAALTHVRPESCWATGPLTGDPIADLIVCPGCRALHAIDTAIAKAVRS